MSKMSDIQIGKEELPITCKNCGRELNEGEINDFYEAFEDGDKPYCYSCIGKMRVEEYTADDDLLEGK